MNLCIIGGSRGIGLGIGLAAVERGDHVSCVSRHAPGSPSITWLKGDVAADAPRAYWPQAGDCDALIYSAGIGLDGVAVGQSSAELDAVWRVNVLGAQRAAKWYMRQRLGRPGCVLFIGSVAGCMGLTGLSAYGATKAALMSYAQGLAREVGPRGWRVNTLCPGFVETDMTQSMTAIQRQALLRRTALGRLGVIQDIVPIALWLISPGAGWITGQAIIADGGFTCA